MLDNKTFEALVNLAPLISIDILITQNDKFLLGNRINRPAKNYFFSPGGRIYKNETIKEALKRIAKKELNLNFSYDPSFIGVYEHFYNDSIYEDVSTHYVNLAYEYHTDDLLNLPEEQHDQYKWFTINEIITDKKVHKYVKNYFRN
tara:strand:+ start:140 stop:577 length:438 start_codon:yes stop_codon:yes gene_type:complete